MIRALLFVSYFRIGKTISRWHERAKVSISGEPENTDYMCYERGTLTFIAEFHARRALMGVRVSSVNHFPLAAGRKSSILIISQHKLCAK
jgi:hypothetical protein